MELLIEFFVMNLVVIGYMWLLSILNIVSVIEDLYLKFCYIIIWLVGIILIV